VAAPLVGQAQRAPGRFQQEHPGSGHVQVAAQVVRRLLHGSGHARFAGVDEPAGNGRDQGLGLKPALNFPLVAQALGNVAARGDEGRTALEFLGLAEQFHRDGEAVAPYEGGLKKLRFAPQGVLKARGRVLALTFGQAVQKVQVGQSAFRQVEPDVRAAVGVKHMAVRVMNEDGVCRAVEEFPELPLGTAQQPGGDAGLQHVFQLPGHGGQHGRIVRVEVCSACVEHRRTCPRAWPSTVSGSSKNAGHGSPLSPPLRYAAPLNRMRA
jgi:hypothetical protein